jgi:hypothetical protein
MIDPPLVYALIAFIALVALVIACCAQFSTPAFSNLVSSGTGDSLISQNLGPALGLKDLKAGLGILLAESQTDITISSDPAHLIAGNGISVTPSALGITIANTETASTVTLSDASGGTGTSLITDGIGPSLAIRQLLGDPNLVLTTPAGNLHMALSPNLTGINTMTGASNSQLTLSTPGEVGVGENLTTNLTWYLQPRSKWNTPNLSVSTFTPDSSGATTGYIVPMPGGAQNNDERFFVTNVDGVTTFTGTSARYVTVQYTLTTEIQETVGVEATARSLYFYVLIGTNPIAPFPITVGTRNYAIARLPEGNPTAPAQTNTCVITDQFNVAPNDQFQLAVIYVGTFAAAPFPTFSGICCNIVATLTPL